MILDIKLPPEVLKAADKIGAIVDQLATDVLPKISVRVEEAAFIDGAFRGVVGASLVWVAVLAVCVCLLIRKRD